MISSVAGLLTRWIAPVLTVAALALTASPMSPEPSAIRLVSDGNPLAGMPFYVDPSSKAMAAARANPDSALQVKLAQMADTPAAQPAPQAEAQED